jgi:uncharacterized sporulation protein YeaH/YhbH (DUF444 family)
MKRRTKTPEYQAPEEDQNDQLKNLMQNEIDELKDAVRYLELQLIDKKKDQEALMRQLEDANYTAKGHENNLNQEKSVTKTQAQRLEDMRRKLKDHQDAQDEVSSALLFFT